MCEWPKTGEQNPKILHNFFCEQTGDHGRLQIIQGIDQAAKSGALSSGPAGGRGEDVMRVTKVVHLLMSFGMGFLAIREVGHANHAATSGTVSLTGDLADRLELFVTEEPGYNHLDLAVNATDVLIATIRERSNNKRGYTVILESANAVADSVNVARFKGALGNPDRLSYSIRYGGKGVTLGGAVGTGRAIVTDSNSKTTGQGLLRNLAISYSGGSVFLAPDTYSDTIRVTIADK